jgi:hypothetical protein
MEESGVSGEIDIGGNGDGGVRKESTSALMMHQIDGDQKCNVLN